MSYKQIAPSGAKYLERDRLILVNLNTVNVYKMKGSYDRWFLYSSIDNTICFTIKNATLVEALSNWINQDELNHLIYLADEDTSNVVGYGKDYLSLQQKVLGRPNNTDVDSEAQGSNLLRKSLNFIRRLFHKRNT